MNKSNPVGIGIVGCGMISISYAKSIITHPEYLKIVGAYDIASERAKEFTKQFGGQVFQTMEELLDSPEVELIVNLTIQTAHYQMTQQALEAGKHVYSEKPLAIRREEGSELVRIAKERNLLLGCAPFVILGEAQQTLWKAVRDGMVGEVVEVIADMMHGRIERNYHPNPVPFYGPGAGPLLDVGCYPLSILTSILGPVRTVRGMAEIRIPERTIGIGPNKGKKFTVMTPDHVTGLLKFANGVGGRITASFVVEKTTHTGIEIHGTKGSLWIASPEAFDSEVRFCPIGEDWQKVPFVSQPYHGIEWSRGPLDMAKAIRNNCPFHCTGEQANHILDLSLGILEAAEKGCEKSIESTFEPPKPVYL